MVIPGEDQATAVADLVEAATTAAMVPTMPSTTVLAMGHRTLNTTTQPAKAKPPTTPEKAHHTDTNMVHTATGTTAHLPDDEAAWAAEAGATKAELPMAAGVAAAGEDRHAKAHSPAPTAPSTSPHSSNPSAPTPSPKLSAPTPSKQPAAQASRSSPRRKLRTHSRRPSTSSARPPATSCTWRSRGRRKKTWASTGTRRKACCISRAWCIGTATRRS